MKSWSNIIGCSVVATVLGLGSVTAGRAQIYLANSGGDTISEYNADGSVSNASLIAGLDDPAGLAIGGSDLYVVNDGDGTIGQYTLVGPRCNPRL